MTDGLLAVVIVLLLVLAGLLVAILRAVRDLPFQMAERLIKGPGLESGPLSTVIEAMRHIVGEAEYNIVRKSGESRHQSKTIAKFNANHEEVKLGQYRRTECFGLA